MFHKNIWPQSKELPWSEWQIIISQLEGIREIVLTGGEPMLYSGFPELCNFILQKGYFLMVFSNLQSKKGLQVIPHRNYMIYASHHRELTKKGEETWQNNYKLYSKKYNIRVDELGKDKKILSMEEEYANCYLKARFTIDSAGGFHYNLLGAMKTYTYDKIKIE